MKLYSGNNNIFSPRRKQDNVPNTNVTDIMNEDNIAQNENKSIQGDMQNVGHTLKV